MNNGIITYNNQIFYKLINDYLHYKIPPDIGNKIIENHKFEDEIIKSLKINDNEEILRDISDDFYYDYTKYLKCYDKAILKLKKEIYDNTYTYENYTYDEALLNKASEIIDEHNDTNISKIKEIKDLATITNIGRNMKIRNQNELRLIINYIFHLCKKYSVSEIKTDINLRYYILLELIRKDFNFPTFKQDNLEILKSLESYLGNLSNVSVKNMSQYIKNFCDQYGKDKNLYILKKYFKFFKRINSYTYFSKSNHYFSLRANIGDFLSGKLKKRDNRLYKKYLYKNKIITKQQLNENFFTDEVKRNILNRVENMEEPEGLNINIGKENFYFINLKYYKIMIWNNYMGIMDSANLTLIIKSLERLINLHTYNATQRINADINKEYSNRKKFQDCYSVYMDFIYKTYKNFVEKLYDLNKLPRYFFDFHDLINSLIANNNTPFKQFSKVDKILNSFSEKSYEFGNEKETAEYLIEKFGTKISLEVTKAYKFLTTPDYDFIKAIRDLQETFSKDSGYNEDFFEEFDALQAREICKLFYKKYNTYPNFEFPDYEVKYTDEEGEKTKTVSYGDSDFKPTKLSLDYWKKVKIGKIFPYTSYSDIYNMEIKDKRKIINDTAFYSSYIESNYLNRETNSEILYALKNNVTLDIKNFKDKLMNDSEIGDIPIVLAYKDEIHKPASRLFFMAPTEFRSIISELEYNLEKLLNLKPGNVMTSGNKIINDKLESIENITGLGDNYFHQLISFDLKKFSTRFPRDILKRELYKLSILFGAPIINKIGYCIDHTKVFHTANSVYFSFKPEHGCYEGFLNKFWTNYHIDVMTYSVYKIKKEIENIIHLDYHLSVFSDDGVLAIKSRNPLKKELNNHDFKEKISSRIYNSVRTSYANLGLVISEDKTYVSDNYAVFLNKIYYNGQYLQNPMKAYMRISNFQVNKVNTLFNKIQYIFSTIQGALTNGLGIIHGWVTYILYSYETLYEQYPTFRNMDMDNRILFLFTDKQLGGIGINSMQSLCSSLEYDKLCSSNYCLFVIYKNNQHLKYRINRLLNQNLRSFDLLSLGLNSLNMPFVSYKNADEYFNVITRECLSKYINNDFYRTFLSRDTLNIHEDILNSIWDCKDLDLYLFNLIVSLSPYNYFQNIINGIDKTDTVKHILKVSNLTNINKKLSLIDNSYIDNFNNITLNGDVYDHIKVNDYSNYLLPINIQNVKSTEEVFDITVYTRKRFFHRDDLTHVAEVCCTLGIDFNMNLTVSTMQKCISDPEFKTKLIDFLLNLETSYQSTPIFSFIRKTNILENYEYINDINEINLKSYSLKVSGFQESNLPKFLDNSHFDNIVSKIMLLDQLQNYHYINIKHTLYLLHIAWQIPLDPNLHIYNFSLEKNVLAHLLINRSNHSFLGERQSMDLQIVNARSVKKLDSKQNFDIYRFLLNIRILTASELEIQNSTFRKFLTRMPVYFFNLTKIIFDPYNDLEKSMSGTIPDDNNLLFDTYTYEQKYKEYSLTIKNQLIIPNDFKNTIWEELGSKVKDFVDQNFIDGGSKFTDEYNFTFDNYPEEFKYLASLPSAQKDQVINYITNLRVERVSNEDKKQVQENEEIIVRDDLRNHRFLFNDRYLYDTIPIEEHFYTFISSFIKSLNIKEYSIIKKNKNELGSSTEKLTEFGKMIASILFKSGVMKEDSLQISNEYRDFERVNKILQDNNIISKIQNYINNSFSQFPNVCRKLLLALSRSMNFKDNNNIMKLPELFINLIENIWKTKDGVKNLQYSWCFYYFSEINIEKRNSLLNDQIRRYLIFTNSLYKIYYKNKLNSLSSEISFKKSLKKKEDVDDLIFNRTLIQLKKSLLNIRLSGLFYVQNNLIFFDSQKFKCLFIDRLNNNIKKYLRNKTLNKEILITDINYGKDVTVFWSDDPSAIFRSVNEDKLISILYENYYTFLKKDCNMFNTNLYKIEGSLDIKYTANYYYSVFVPMMSNMDTIKVEINVNRDPTFEIKRNTLEQHTYVSPNNAIFNYYSDFISQKSKEMEVKDNKIGSKDIREFSTTKFEFEISKPILDSVYENTFKSFYSPKVDFVKTLTSDFSINLDKLESKKQILEENKNVEFEIIKSNAVKGVAENQVPMNELQANIVEEDLEDIEVSPILDGFYNECNLTRIKPYILDNLGTDLLLPYYLPPGFYEEEMVKSEGIKLQITCLKDMLPIIDCYNNYMKKVIGVLTSSTDRSFLKNSSFPELISKEKLRINNFELMNNLYYLFYFLKKGGVDEDSMKGINIFHSDNIIFNYLNSSFQYKFFQQIIYDGSFKITKREFKVDINYMDIIDIVITRIISEKIVEIKKRQIIIRILKNICNSFGFDFETNCFVFNSYEDYDLVGFMKKEKKLAKQEVIKFMEFIKGDISEDNIDIITSTMDRDDFFDEFIKPYIIDRINKAKNNEIANNCMFFGKMFNYNFIQISEEQLDKKSLIMTIKDLKFFIYIDPNSDKLDNHEMEMVGSVPYEDIAEIINENEIPVNDTQITNLKLLNFYYPVWSSNERTYDDFALSYPYLIKPTNEDEVNLIEEDDVTEILK